ncbi:MAG: SRPBCC family protein [Deltaproteobacteria bacterium]
MTQAYTKGAVNASAASVWKVIREFIGLENFIPPIVSSTLKGSGVGAQRTLTTKDGGQIIERLESLDDSARELKYSIVSSRLPVEGYLAVITIHDLGGGKSEVEWAANFTVVGGAPEADIKARLEGLFGLAIAGLNKLLGS